MSDAAAWKERLQDQMPPDLAEEIDLFEAQLELRQNEGIDERVFAETRLRRGMYGQRYDNGQRHDGVESRDLAYPSAPTKGPDTLWHAPGMVRIKIPYGGATPEQLEVIAECAEEYSDAILHITTRQDVQLHYLHLDDGPTLMRRLASVGITTREACGNGVRNVTGCPLAGVCRTEAFDVTPYADALFRFLLGHPDCQDFGRKFKPAFSGCEHEACGLVMMHDLGFIAKVKQIDGEVVRGFDVYVGGGLGTNPFQAELVAEFALEGEILPLAQAIGRVFARLGEKKNRNRARIKFLVAKLGIEEFRRLVTEERRQLPHDPRWTDYLRTLDDFAESPKVDSTPLNGAGGPEGFDEWFGSNVYPQRQEGYVVATVALPLGDITSEQVRLLADVARKYVGDAVRTTVEQNIVLRWVAEHDLPALYSELKEIGLATPGAGTIVDITACPGTDTCKLGIASSRGLAGELTKRLAAKQYELDESVRGLKIKVSGCFNSCGQHHVADIGFFGNARAVDGVTVPHFQVVLGGQWSENAGSFGMPVGAVPSKRIPEVVDALADRFISERDSGESFQEFTSRLGKKELGELVKSFKDVPPPSEHLNAYVDWGDSREFSRKDMGVGECAGEVVTRVDMELSAAESVAFEAQIALDEGDLPKADAKAFEAMLVAAEALVRTQLAFPPEDPDDLVREFRERFFDTELFFDRFAKGKFARPLFERHESGPAFRHERDVVGLIENTSLFIDAAYQCDIRMAGAQSAAV